MTKKEVLDEVIEILIREAMKKGLLISEQNKSDQLKSDKHDCILHQFY